MIVSLHSYIAVPLVLAASILVGGLAAVLVVWIAQKVLKEW